MGMATKYGEIVLGMLYHEKNKKDQYVGDPMYYISKGLKLPFLAKFTAMMMVVHIIGDNFIQSNDIAGVVSFLASPDAAYISGARIAAHGGGERPVFLSLAQAG